MARRRRQPPASAPPHPIATYWDRTQWPLQALYFLSPLLVLYEVGTLVYAPAGSRRLPQIWAESLVGKFFEVFGVSGYYLPGILVVVVLLCWHLVKRDPWRPEPKLYLGMTAESILLAVPLFVLMLVLFRQPPGPGGAPSPGSMTHAATQLAAAVGGGASGGDGGLSSIHSYPGRLVLAIGAGIYEELLFRLIAIALLHLLLADVLALPEPWPAAGAVIGSAIAFGGYHFATRPFDWGLFGFYTLAGGYFAVIYVLRGFGIVAAVHAVYDILAISLDHWMR